VIGELVFGALAGLLGLGLFVKGIRKLRSGVGLYRNRTTPLPKIPQTEDPVEFDGRAAPTTDEGAFEAPFSGTEALCCQFWMEKASRHKVDDEDDGVDINLGGEHQSVGDTEVTWGLANTDEVRREFAVTDGGNRVVVDPTDADFDMTGHMGEVALKIGKGETLSEDARARLETLDDANDEFDGSLETWDDEGSAVKYREARLEPGSEIHVAGGTVHDTPDEWGSGIEATIGAPAADDQFLISRGTESEVVRRHLVGFVTGTIVGIALLGLGVWAIRVGLSG
jgi:hypothetical protein